VVKFNINITGVTINVMPKIPILLALILVISLIGIFIISGMQKTLLR